MVNEFKDTTVFGKKRLATLQMSIEKRLVGKKYESRGRNVYRFKFAKDDMSDFRKKSHVLT